MMEELRSSEMSVLTGATLYQIPEDVILHSHRRENLKSFVDAEMFSRTIWKLEMRHPVLIAGLVRPLFTAS
jgi:hypothetical protein